MPVTAKAGTRSGFPHEAMRQQKTRARDLRQILRSALWDLKMRLDSHVSGTISSTEPCHPA